MRQHHQPTTVVAILGADTLGEDILARLLREEGYATRLIVAPHPTGLVDELLEGVDVVLLSPGLKDSVREAFLEAMRSTPNTAVMPVLTLPAALKLALLDELSASASWRSLFEELVGQIGAALARAATSAGALLVEGCGGGEPAAQADAL
jgi:ABC-type antimicrobial peptide transport system permease subunit